MKRKMLLPLFAVLFAVLGAFASSPLVQQKGWYKNALGQVVEDFITTPADTDIQPCSTSGMHFCRVGSKQAYDTQANAAAQDPAGELKYN